MTVELVEYEKLNLDDDGNKYFDNINLLTGLAKAEK